MNNLNSTYIFTSERLGFRNWLDTDISAMSEINSDPDVMEFFPSLISREQTSDFIDRMKNMFTEKRYCYFAVERLSDQAFIGFIGLCDQSFESEVTPCVDMGWRLHKNFWKNGYATEGAMRCLEYGFKNIGLKNVKAIAPKVNLKSIHVMEKIGMKKTLEFNHPKLENDPRLRNCVCFEINNQ